MQLKCPSDEICSNETLEYDKSTIKEKLGYAKAVVGVLLPESNQIARENINRYYRRGNFKIIF